MAVIKFVTTPTDAVGEYARIVNAQFIEATQLCVVTTDIYTSADSRAEGKPPIWQDRVNIPFAAFAEHPFKTLYPLIQQYSFSPFKGGVSDEEVVPTTAIALTEQAKADVDFPSGQAPFEGSTNGVELEVFPEWSATTIPADGVSTVTITGLPDPTTFEFVSAPGAVGPLQRYVESSGTFGFSTTVPGNYTIKASAFPYMNSIVTIIATVPGAIPEPEPAPPEPEPPVEPDPEAP